MRGHHIIVSGSSSGIGKSISKLLLSKGATVIGLSRSPEKFNPKNPRFKSFDCDIADLERLPVVVSKIISVFPTIDGFVSNAGFGDFKGLENFSSDQIVSYLNANLISHIIMTRALIPIMKKQKKGKIIFIGSEAALRGSQKGSLYNVAKFGLRGFSQAIRDECAKSNIHVSIVNPGMVRTSFFDRLSFSPGDDSSNAIEPDDIAKVVFSIFEMRLGTVIDEINVSPLNKVIKFNKDEIS